MLTMNGSTSQVTKRKRAEKEFDAVSGEIKLHTHAPIFLIELVERNACERAYDAHPHQGVEEVKVGIDTIAQHQEWLLD